MNTEEELNESAESYPERVTGDGRKEEVISTSVRETEEKVRTPNRNVRKPQESGELIEIDWMEGPPPKQTQADALLNSLRPTVWGSRNLGHVVNTVKNMLVREAEPQTPKRTRQRSNANSPNSPDSRPPSKINKNGGSAQDKDN